MELTFEKVGNQYVAEFQATNDFNLHIERKEIDVLEVHQRGSEEGKYDFAWGTGVNGRKVVDYDFGALVYPKWIKVVSGSEVVSASVNFNEGGGSGNGSGESFVWEYYKINDINTNLRQEAVDFCTYVHRMIDGDPSSEIVRGSAAVNNVYSVKMIACNNTPLLVVHSDANIICDNKSWKNNFLAITGYTEDEFNSILTPITKEEFFTILLPQPSMPA